MDRKEKEPKALVEITVTWREPEATAAGEVVETVSQEAVSTCFISPLLLASLFFKIIKIKSKTLSRNTNSTLFEIWILEFV